MTDFLERISKLSPKRLALLAAELNTNLERLKRRESEPIAIIGMGCRFPGGADPESLWKLMIEGREAIAEVPPDRWDIDTYYDPDPDAPGKMSTRKGGFLREIDRFDPEFFGISPREAAGMDPQQRLLLEVAWEALENAGQSPEHLAGSRTGVFAGLCNNDYFSIQAEAGAGSMDAYVATGSAHSVAPGRISYLLGLLGPSVAVDTSCSSSLVAVHLASQSLRLGECRMALAGGVNLILKPDVTVTLSRAHMMAPDGRCKAFDAAADGFVRAEGCGLIVLKRLSDARADGDRILALVRGTACNQDGKSSGLTAPNGPSQVALIQDALANAGLQPGDVDLIEAHGTGTSLGDPIEARALADVFAAGRASEYPLQVGSVKTNIGHAESAAGIAGVIKSVLALQHQQIPPSLHFKQLNPSIDWNDLPIRVTTTPTPWIHTQGSRVAGISSFGFSGTNAHVIVSDVPVEESVPELKEQITGQPPLHLLPLSARTEPALIALAREYEQTFSREPGLNLADVCQTAGAGRSHFEHRLAIVAADLAEAKELLAAFQRGEKHPRIRTGRSTSATVPGVVFMFTGQGSQYVGMGRELFETQPVFRQELERCAEILKPLLEMPLLEVLFADAAENKPSVLDQTQYSQPALFALEYALAALWRSWGIEPVAVLGHSVGEYVAACVAGVFSLEDALRLIATRARLMQALPRHGAMAAVLAGEDRVRAAIAPYAEAVSIAAVNSPQNTVISGNAESVRAILERLRQDGVESKPLTVSHAFHSPLLESMLDEFENAVRGIEHKAPVIDLVSNVTGRTLDNSMQLNAAYWRRHARGTVRFADSIATLHARGMRAFLEIGPAPVLTGMARQCVTDSNTTWLPSLRKDQDAWSQMLSSLSSLYVLGVNPDWSAIDRSGPHRRLALPTYPFQRQRHWVDTRRKKSASSGRHPLLGEGTRSAHGEWVFESKLSLDSLPYLNDHRVHGSIVLPAGIYLEMAAACGQRAFAGATCALSEFEIREPLVLPESGEISTQFIATPADNGALTFEVFSSDEASSATEPAWTLHATGKISKSDVAVDANPPVLDEVRKRCVEQISGAEYYDRLSSLNIAFGPAFRGVRDIARRDGEALGRLQVSEAASAEASRYQLHPALLDACFQILGAALPGGVPQAGADTYLMVGLGRMIATRPPSAGMFWALGTLRPSDHHNPEILTGDVEMISEGGQVFGRIEGIRLKRATRETLLRSARARFDDWLYEVRWMSKRELSAGRNALPVDYMPDSKILKTSVEEVVPGLWRRYQLDTYGEAVRGLEAVSLEFVIRALRQLGWKLQPGERASTSVLAARLGIVKVHLRLFGRLLEVLEEQGILSRHGGEWVVGAVPSAGDFEARIKLLYDRFPQFAGDISLLQECGTRLAEVLAGTCDPLEILFPGGSMTRVEKVTQDSPAPKVFNELVAQAIEAALAKLPSGRIGRVLEVGAGTGSTTSAVLPRLSDERVEYVFTDLSKLFLAKAQQKFKGRDRMRFGILNLEENPDHREFEEHSFDVVLASNVLHATKNLHETLRNVHRLLAPGGMLILFEATSAQLWVDLIFGLTEGWWRFVDNDLRTSHPLLSRQTWTSLLEKSGFNQVSMIPEGAGSQLPSMPTVVICKSVSQPETYKEGTWLLLSGDEQAAQPWRSALEARGQKVELAIVPDHSGLDDVSVVETVANSYRSLLRSTVAKAGPLQGIVHLVGADAPALSPDAELSGLEASVKRGCVSALSMVQALVNENATDCGRLWLVTRGGLPTTSSACAVSQSPMWGLGRTAAGEHPEFWGGLIDIADAGQQSVATAVEQLLHPGGEDQLAVIGEQVQVGRLMRSAKPAENKPKLPTFRADATYLVTGGFGGMGRMVLNWMAEQGARHIAVMGRSVDPASPNEIVTGLRARGVEVLALRADVADDAALGRAFEQITAALPKLAGVIHIAGIFDDRVLSRQDWPRFERVLKPKVAGGWNLHQRTKHLPLDFFVLFSSGASFLAPAGLGNYAASNAFLDALAHHRRTLGLPAVSINWGPWENVGMAEAVGNRREDQWTQAGFATMTSQQGLAVLQRLIQDAPPQVGVLVVDWPKYLERFGAGAPHLYAELRRASQRTSQKTGQPASTVEQAPRFEDALPAERHNLLFEHICNEAAEVLGIESGSRVDPDQGLFDLGMDSLTAIELKNRLQTTLGKPLPSTLFFDYPNVRKLTEYLERDVLQWDEKPTASGEPFAKAAPVADHDEFSEDELAELLAQKLEQLK